MTDRLPHLCMRKTPSNADQAETSVVYAAGAVQGIVLVTFPAASTIFTDPDEYDLSNTQYGVLFLPQVATAITASLLAATLSSAAGHEARLPDRARLQPRLDGSADPQPVLRVEHGRRVSSPPRGNGLSRRGLRARRPCPEHADGGLPSGWRRVVGARAERPPGARNGARAGLRRDLRRARLLVGPSADVRGPAVPARAEELAASSANGSSPRPARNRPRPGSPAASGCTRPSPFSTACARPSTETGRSWT